MQPQIAISHDDLAGVGIAPARQLERRQRHVVQIRIAGDLHGDMPRRLADMPLRAEHGLILHRLDIGNGLQRGQKIRIEMIDIQNDVRLCGLAAQAEGESGEQGILGGVDGGQAKDADEDTQHHQQRAPPAPYHVGE